MLFRSTVRQSVVVIIITRVRRSIACIPEETSSVYMEGLFFGLKHESGYTSRLIACPSPAFDTAQLYGSSVLQTTSCSKPR